MIFRQPAARRHAGACAGPVDFKIWRDVQLSERAMAGDVDAMIEWLTRFGGPEWQIKG
jgi:hypothetical protein